MKSLPSCRSDAGSPVRPILLLALAFWPGGVLGGCGAQAAVIPDPASPEMMWVKPPSGATALADIGIYRAGYQLYGQEVVDMPPSWSGDFTDDSGIAFLPTTHRGQPGLLLHCPWRSGTGAAFVDYRLDLPKVSPIRFDFALAMREDAVGKSDGVTFSASLSADGQTKELMREHHTKADPRAYRFDLSPYAGKQVVLRIQTEPGPRKDANFDFSIFVDPRITVGPEDGPKDPRKAVRGLLDAMTSTKAYNVLREADLRKLSNRGDQGVVPSCKVAFTNSVAQSPVGALLTYEGADCRIAYQYSPKTGTLDDLVARVDDGKEGKPFRPCSGGGILLAVGGGARGGQAVRPDRAEMVSCKVQDDAVAATWKYVKGDVSATVNWKFRIVGKAIVIDADSPDAAIGSFSLGRPVADFRRTIPVPYLYLAEAAYLPAQNAFVMGYVDWTRSRASQSGGTRSIYAAKLDGKRNALRESAYVAVSPDLDEVLPNIPHPPSPYLKLLGPKMMLDIWGGSFEENARLLEEYKSHGIDELAVIFHNWQRYGYDVKLPDHLPANPNLGGDEKMKLLAGTAKKLGYLFSLHENYIDFYPDAPSWDPNDVVLTPKGEFSKAWYHPGTKVQSFAIKANRMLHYARQNSPEIHKRFGTTAAYLDVHTCVGPWHHVDYDANQELAGTYAAKVKYHAELFRFERDAHGGPLFGEGHNHFYWAGLVDGVEAQVEGGEDRPVLVDFDLLKLHPQMANHGMGYYERWMRGGRTAKRGGEWRTPEMLDKYRAQELAYGHVSFIGSGMQGVMPAVVREYNLCQPVHALYGDAKVTRILYEVDGNFVTGSVAAVAGVLDRVQVKYDSDLTLHVNLRKDDWTVGRYVLPQYGFLAEGPNVLVCTARRDGVIVDFARTKDSLYVDSRSEVYRPWAAGRKDIEPRVKSFKDLGGGKFEIAYEWVVNDILTDDLTCFVHFCKDDPQDGEGIVFQNDHPPPTPTSQWKPGATLADGPHRLQLPAGDASGSYDILIGLYGKGGRANLKGTPAGANRIILSRLVVTRKEGKVEKVELAGIDDLKKALEEGQSRFTDRMNAAGRKIDFGPAATDGAFKVLAMKGRLELLAFPRGKKFQVELDVKELTGRGGVTKVEVVAVDEAGKELTRVLAALSGGRLTFEAGVQGAVRYSITY